MACQDAEEPHGGVNVVGVDDHLGAVEDEAALCVSVCLCGGSC